MLLKTNNNTYNENIQLENIHCVHNNLHANSLS
jgi:hypothetical protein